MSNKEKGSASVSSNPNVHQKRISNRNELQLILDCRLLELLSCDPDSWMYSELKKEISQLQKRLARLDE